MSVSLRRLLGNRSRLNATSLHCQELNKAKQAKDFLGQIVAAVNAETAGMALESRI